MFIASREATEHQISNAEYIYSKVSKYLKLKLSGSGMPGLSVIEPDDSVKKGFELSEGDTNNRCDPPLGKEES